MGIDMDKEKAIKYYKTDSDAIYNYAIMLVEEQ